MRFAIIENGKVVNTVIADEPFEGGIPSETANIGDSWDGKEIVPYKDYYLILDIALSGGDGRNDPIGVFNDGANAIHAVVTLKSEDGATMPESGMWRILMRHADGSEYETINVTMGNGIIEFDYKTSNQKTGQVFINEGDLTEKFTIGGHEYRLKISGNNTFKVSRNMETI